jgi:hypothetical protein
MTAAGSVEAGKTKKISSRDDTIYAWIDRAVTRMWMDFGEFG